MPTPEQLRFVEKYGELPVWQCDTCQEKRTPKPNGDLPDRECCEHGNFEPSNEAARAVDLEGYVGDGSTSDDHLPSLVRWLHRAPHETPATRAFLVRAAATTARDLQEADEITERDFVPLKAEKVFPTLDAPCPCEPCRQLRSREALLARVADLLRRLPTEDTETLVRQLELRLR